jgi:hypothetical protein
VTLHADSVVVTKNEILTALNKPEECILALVEVDGDRAHTLYLKKPIRTASDFYATGVIYSLSELTGGAEIMYEHTS